MSSISASSRSLSSEDSFGHNMRAINRLLQRELSSRVVKLGLNIGQWYALRTLWESDGITQIDLAQQSGIAGPAMVAAVRGLLTMGLVTRQHPPHDKRKYLINLTEKGWDLRKSAVEIALDVNDLALEGISNNDIETCLSVFRAVQYNLLPLAENAKIAADEADKLIVPSK